VFHSYRRKKFANFTTDDICGLLVKLGLNANVDKFKLNAVDGESLVDGVVTFEDLTDELNMTLIQKKKFLHHLKTNYQVELLHVTVEI